MIVPSGSVFDVFCPSFGSPSALTWMLASPSDHLGTASFELFRFIPSFLGKMAVFDKTESLVMSLVQRFHCCRQFRRASCHDKKELPDKMELDCSAPCKSCVCQGPRCFRQYELSDKNELPESHADQWSAWQDGAVRQDGAAQQDGAARQEGVAWRAL